MPYWEVMVHDVALDNATILGEAIDGTIQLLIGGRRGLDVYVYMTKEDVAEYIFQDLWEHLDD